MGACTEDPNMELSQMPFLRSCQGKKLIKYIPTMACSFRVFTLGCLYILTGTRNGAMCMGVYRETRRS